MYRTKGRISRTPLLTVAIAVRKFTTVLEIDCALCAFGIKNRARGGEREQDQPVGTQAREGVTQAQGPTNLHTESGDCPICFSGTYK